MFSHVLRIMVVAGVLVAGCRSDDDGGDKTKPDGSTVDTIKDTSPDDDLAPELDADVPPDIPTPPPDGPVKDQDPPLDIPIDIPILPDGPAPDVGVSPMVGKIIITEFLANPSAVGDTAGEWVEVHNSTTADIDLQGWTLMDDDSDKHVISASVVVPAGGYVILARNQTSADNGGVTAAYQYDDFQLANKADEIVLLDDGGAEVDRIVYTDVVVYTGASLQLKDPSLDNSDLANWCAASTEWSGSTGDFGTPGAETADCRVFLDAGSDSVVPDAGVDATQDVGSDADAS